MTVKVGIIGFGNMGSAIYERLKGFGDLQVFDKDIFKTSRLSRSNVAKDLSNLVKTSRIIILAVKPQDFEGVLNEIKDSLLDSKLIISIAAGITTGYIENHLGNIAVIRVMPNMPAKIGRGMSCLCKGMFATAADLEFTQRMFRELGETLILNEDMMDAATAVSGSGPGFFCDSIRDKQPKEWERYAQNVFIPQFTSAAQGVGFTNQQAKVLAVATTQGSIALLKEMALKPGDLCSQVASKGGTTEAGLEILRKGGTLQDAVKAAVKRAAELSRR